VNVVFTTLNATNVNSTEDLKVDNLGSL